jgi:hypothetical protein
VLTPTDDHAADRQPTAAELRAQELVEDIARAELIENTPTEVVYGQTRYGSQYVELNGATFVEDAGSVGLCEELDEHLAAHPELQDHPIHGRYWSGPDDDGERPTGEDQPAAGADMVGLVCPECGEDAVEQPPTALVPYQAHEQAVPAYSHPDGEPLCPVMGPRGYQPADPVEVLADADAGDPLDQARAAVDAADHTATEHTEHTDQHSGQHSGVEHDAGRDDGAGWDR